MTTLTIHQLRDWHEKKARVILGKLQCAEKLGIANGPHYSGLKANYEMHRAAADALAGVISTHRIPK